MHFTNKDKAAIWSLIKEIKFLENEDYDAQKTAQRMNAIHNFLSIDAEVERISKMMDMDTYIPHIKDMSFEQKEYVSSILLMVIMADGKATEGEIDLLNKYMKFCELPKPTDEKKDDIFMEIFAAGQNVSQSVKRTSDSSNGREWQYYQKKLIKDYEENKSEFKWIEIMPLTAQEAIGAMAFCKSYLKVSNWNNESVTTLARIIDLCDEEYIDDPKVSKVLPKYKEALEQYMKDKKQKKENHRERKERERIEAETEKKKAETENKKKKHILIILWVVVLIAIVLQIIFWEWWAILSGILTVAIALIVSFFVFMSMS